MQPPTLEKQATYRLGIFQSQDNYDAWPGVTNAVFGPIIFLGRQDVLVEKGC